MISINQYAGQYKIYYYKSLDEYVKLYLIKQGVSFEKASLL